MRGMILFILSIMMLVGCNQNDIHHNKALEKAIYSTVKEEKMTEVNIDSFVDSPAWDKAFLFTPYTTQESINEQLGFPFKDPVNLEMRDDINLLVFVYKGKVIQYVKLKRQYADFTIGEKKYLTPSDAIMKIESY